MRLAFDAAWTNAPRQGLATARNPEELMMIIKEIGPPVVPPR
jgi:hypothetical protein